MNMLHSYTTYAFIGTDARAAQRRPLCALAVEASRYECAAGTAQRLFPQSNPD